MAIAPTINSKPTALIGPVSARRATRPFWLAQCLLRFDMAFPYRCVCPDLTELYGYSSKRDIRPNIHHVTQHCQAEMSFSWRSYAAQARSILPKYAKIGHVASLSCYDL